MQGLPLIKPPYGRVTAINMNSGEHAWQVPLGDGIRQRLIGMGVPDPGPQGGGAFTGQTNNDFTVDLDRSDTASVFSEGARSDRRRLAVRSGDLSPRVARQPTRREPH